MSAKWPSEVILQTQVRIAALRAANELAASGRIYTDPATVLERAERYERWLLREGDEGGQPDREG